MKVENALTFQKKWNTWEIVAFICAFCLFAAVEIFHAYVWTSRFGPWAVKGFSIPLISLISIISMLRSIGLQKRLKLLGAPDPIKNTAACFNYLVETEHTGGLQLLEGIARAGAYYAFSFGLAIALCVFATFQV